MSSATYFSTVISQQGMSYVMQASPTGPLIDISYFVPVYDYRIDPDISIDGTPLSAFSAVAQELIDTSATSATGEHIWFLPSDLSIKYDLSDAYALIREVAGNYQSEPEEILDGALQTNNPSVGVNLLSGTPISDTISADTMYYDLQTNTWKLSNYSLVLGNNNIMPSETTVDNYYRVADYHPVGSGDSLRGSYTCRINSNNGKFKFNKIALYCVLRNGDGTLYNGDGAPKFFGECYIQEPIIKSSFGSAGFDDIVCNVQINITSVTSAFDNVFYSTSGDYWQRWINSLHYPFKVSVGHFDDNVEPDALVHVKRAKVGENSTIDNDIPHLRLDYDADTYASFKMTSSSNYSPDDAEMGDLVISANVGPTYCGKVLTIRPAVDSTVNLGKPTHPFGRMWLDELTMNDDINAHDIIPSEDVTYSLGTADLYWKNIYAQDIFAGHIKVNGNIDIPSPNGITVCNIESTSNGYGNIGIWNGFNSIYVKNIHTPYKDTSIILHNDLFPSSNIDLGNSINKFTNIYGVNGLFDSVIVDDKTIGEWIDISIACIVQNGSASGFEDQSIQKSIRCAYIGKNTVVINGRFQLETNDTSPYIRIWPPFYPVIPSMVQYFFNAWDYPLTNTIQGIIQEGWTYLAIYKVDGTNFPSETKFYYINAIFEIS